MNQVHVGDRGCRETLNDIPPKQRVISRINSNKSAQTLSFMRRNHISKFAQPLSLLWKWVIVKHMLSYLARDGWAVVN